jgi:hypothetical protein
MSQCTAQTKKTNWRKNKQIAYMIRERQMNLASMIQFLVFAGIDLPRVQARVLEPIEYFVHNVPTGRREEYYNGE